MKKILTCLLSGLLAVLCLFTCIGCKAKPALSINEADVALSDKGYEVEIEYGGNFDDIDVDGIVKKQLYAKKGEDRIEIYEFEKFSTAKVAYNMAVDMYKQRIATWETYIEFYEHILENYNDEMTSEEIDDMQDELKEIRKYLKEAEKRLKAIGRSGRFVWIASDVDVVEDAR